MSISLERFAAKKRSQLPFSAPKKSSQHRCSQSVPLTSAAVHRTDIFLIPLRQLEPDIVHILTKHSDNRRPKSAPKHVLVNFHRISTRRLLSLTKSYFDYNN